MTDEELKKQAVEHIESVATATSEKVTAKAIEEQAEKFASKEDVTAVKTELSQKMDSMSAEVKKQMQTRSTAKMDTTSPRAGIVAMASVVKGLVYDNAETINASKRLDETTKAITPESFLPAGAYQGLNSQDMPMDLAPYAPVYLRTLFPNISTSKEMLSITQRDAVTGEAKVWDYADGEKPEVTPTWKVSDVKVDWIAGLTHVQRSVLDDIEFVRTEIPHALIYSPQGIMAAENKLILDYIKTNAVPFTGDAQFGVGVERILAAGFWQLGNQYLTPTHLLINRADYLTYLQFNKASGSGQYDLPNTAISFINGRMFISGLEAVPVNELASKEAYVIDASRSRFVSRQEVRLEVSTEHADNFSKNMVTFRAEERVGFYTYDVNSFVKITLPEITEEP